MLFVEPPETDYDVRFSIAGIPIRIHPLFWLIVVLLGAAGGTEPVPMLVWVIAVFASILLHELGHAFAIRRFGWRPRIVLHSFGGLAIYQPTHQQSPQKQIVISLAGPAAGFLLAIALVVLLSATGTGLSLFGIRLGGAEPIGNPMVRLLLFYLLFINIFWGLINLAPVFPLDGGKVLCSVMEVVDPRRGTVTALRISAGVGALVAVASLVYLQSILMTVLFGMAAYQSYQLSQQYGGYGRPW